LNASHLKGRHDQVQLDGAVDYARTALLRRERLPPKERQACAAGIQGAVALGGSAAVRGGTIGPAKVDKPPVRR